MVAVPSIGTYLYIAESTFMYLYGSSPLYKNISSLSEEHTNRQIWLHLAIRVYNIPQTFFLQVTFIILVFSKSKTRQFTHMVKVPSKDFCIL